MTSLVAAAAFFVGIHVFVSGTALRDAVVARMGENAFRGLFSLASLGGIVWMAMAYRRAPLLALWTPPQALRLLALPLVLLAFLLVVVGLSTPSPTAVAGEALLAGGPQAEPARGILRVTRHPFLWGVAAWAVAHLLANGDAASLAFFGGFLVLALVGPFLIDRRRRASFGAAWERFAGATSNVPFAAITAGRNRFAPGEIGALRIAAALVLYGVVLVSHGALFGVPALP